MRKHCGNCANHRKETNGFSEECGKCVACVMGTGERTAPSHWRAKPQPNAGRIRAMSDEELARELADIWGCHNCSEYDRLDGRPLLKDDHCDQECEKHCLEWLKQPAERRCE